MGIRIATLNVWALPGPFADQVERRMQAIGARLGELDVDVVAFQEVWTADARRHLVAAGRDAGLDGVWHTHGALGGSGLLVLSRLPMDLLRFEPFDLRGHPERLDQAEYYGHKGFVRLRLHTGTGPLTLIDTHLHAPYSNDVAHEYRMHRAGQAVELALASRGTADPLVAVGDFNFEETQPEYRVLTGLTGLRDVAAELDRRQATVWAGNAYRSPTHRGKRIDYVFVRDGTEAALQPVRVERIFDEPLELEGKPRSYSDHAGVLAELELATRPGRPEPPDRQAVELARRLLRAGSDEARERRGEQRAWAGAGFGTAVIAAAGMRTAPVSRRQLLRATLHVSGILALTPGLGFGLLSEYFVQEEIRAFESLAARLAQLDGRPRHPIA